MTSAMFLLMASLGKAEEPDFPLDCLAGICLGEPGPETKSSAKVAGRSWHLTTEVCSGQIVVVGIETGWSSFRDAKPNWSLKGLPVAFVTEWDALDEPKRYYDEVLQTMSEMGWVVKPFREDRPEIPFADHTQGSAVNFATHPRKKGERQIFYSYSIVGAFLKGASMYLSTTHPDYLTLCAPKRQQGL